MIWIEEEPDLRLPQDCDIRPEGIFERGQLQQPERNWLRPEVPILSDITLAMMGRYTLPPLESISLLRVTAEIDMPDLVMELLGHKKFPIALNQLMPIIFMPEFSSFRCIFALTSAEAREREGQEMLAAVPYVFLVKTLASVKEKVAKLNPSDANYRRIVESTRSGRYLGCDFRNRYNSRNMLLAVTNV